MTSIGDDWVFDKITTNPPSPGAAENNTRQKNGAEFYAMKLRKTLPRFRIVHRYSGICCLQRGGQRTLTIMFRRQRLLVDRLVQLPQSQMRFTHRGRRHGIRQSLLQVALGFAP